MHRDQGKFQLWHSCTLIWRSIHYIQCGAFMFNARQRESQEERDSEKERVRERERKRARDFLTAP